jgi:hypothetical protein
LLPESISPDSFFDEFCYGEYRFRVLRNGQQIQEYKMEYGSFGECRFDFSYDESQLFQFQVHGVSEEGRLVRLAGSGLIKFE